MTESKEQKVTLLKAYQQKLQNLYEGFSDLLPCDIIPELTIRDVKNDLIEKSDTILKQPEKYSPRMIRYANMLSDKQVRAQRAEKLLARREKKIESKKEKIARIADYYGFDGSLFRDLFPVDNPLSAQQARLLQKKIETIAKIIGKIEQPVLVDRTVIPEQSELLTVAQTATFLGWGESVVRQRDKEGLLPLPYRFGGTIQWSRKELKNWIESGCPKRAKWEILKRKGA